MLDSGFLATAPSLLIQLMADDSYVQAILTLEVMLDLRTCCLCHVARYTLQASATCFRGERMSHSLAMPCLRHSTQRNFAVIRWRVPGQKRIVTAAANERQAPQVWIISKAFESSRGGAAMPVRLLLPCLAERFFISRLTRATL